MNNKYAGQVTFNNPDKVNSDGAVAPAIVVIGLGSAGCCLVQHMADTAKLDNTRSIENLQFVLADTSNQALETDSDSLHIFLGEHVTKGLGAGANPDIGRQAAEESYQTIAAALRGADAIFLIAGMGGGTGTGAAPVVVDVAKELDIPLTAIVTRPFPFEGKKRAAIADEGIMQLSKKEIALFTIPNSILLEQPSYSTTMNQAFKSLNDFIFSIVQAGILRVTANTKKDTDSKASSKTGETAMNTQHISAKQIEVWWKNLGKEDRQLDSDCIIDIIFSDDRMMLCVFQDNGPIKELLTYTCSDESLLNMLDLIRSKGIDTPPIETFLADTNEQPEAEPLPEKSFWKTVGLVCGGITTGLLAYRLIN